MTSSRSHRKMSTHVRINRMSASEISRKMNAAVWHTQRTTEQHGPGGRTPPRTLSSPPTRRLVAARTRGRVGGRQRRRRAPQRERSRSTAQPPCRAEREQADAQPPFGSPRDKTHTGQNRTQLWPSTHARINRMSASKNSRKMKVAAWHAQRTTEQQQRQSVE